MSNHSRMAELLVETGAFTDLDSPVILASGQLGIYYVNTEKLVQDGGIFNSYGDNSRDMIKHAIEMKNLNPSFGEVIDIVAQDIKNKIPFSKYIISGGQRRDWLFSGPVAHELDVPHLALYKNGDYDISSTNDPYAHSINVPAVHVVDLLTEGSSCYREENGVEKGWIPNIRNQGKQIQNLFAIVTRNQGGEQNLLNQEVHTHTYVSIDKDFLAENSTNPNRAIEYYNDPETWSKNWLREHGAQSFVHTFHPNEKKTEKGLKFLERYRKVLSQNDELQKLTGSVQERYGVTIQ